MTSTSLPEKRICADDVLFSNVPGIPMLLECTFCCFFMKYSCRPTVFQKQMPLFQTGSIYYKVTSPIFNPPFNGPFARFPDFYNKFYSFC